MLPVLIRIPVEDEETIRAEAAARGVDIVEVYREAIAVLAAKLRQSTSKQQQVDTK